MDRIPLGGKGWTVRCTRGAEGAPARAMRGTFAATVPGTVHTDLLAAGVIPDPYIADNERIVQWVGESDWAYETAFTLGAEALAHEFIDLACDGLDTVASVTLNGQEIGTAANMHLRQRFDLRGIARAGSNTLKIQFASPVAFARLSEEIQGHYPHTGHGANAPQPHNMIRKASCSFGWDWGPALPTSGIWRDIRVEAWSKWRIAAVRAWASRATVAEATLEIEVDLDERPGEKAAGTGAVPVRLAPFRVVLRDPAGGEAEIEGVVRPFGLKAKHTVENPRLWWPVGHGAQPLYTLKVQVEEEVHVCRIGLRTVELDTTPDAGVVGDPVPGKRGETFTLRVNGKAIYCKGADWIPDDCFLPRVTRERYRQRLTQARDANMNMVRVWGGGIYEDDAFYEICDELGLMVWQDFAFACAMYPETEPYWSSVEEEARDNINRLMSHPSLAVWNGCNENIWGASVWGAEWEAAKRDVRRPWGLGYYLSLLPRMLNELDPERPYWPASPYSGTFDREPNANEYGNRHIWDVWHGPGQYRNYLAHYPRMATEFGFHGPPTWPTLARSVSEGQRRWDAPLMKWHNKNGPPERDGQEQCTRRMGDDFVPPLGAGEFDDWLYLAQIMQARALEMGVTWFRALFPWNSGALYWQFNDCWPVASWSAVDGDGRAKPLWFATRRFFAPRLVTIKPARAVAADGGDEAVTELVAYLHNDHDEAWEAEVVLERWRVTGEAPEAVERRRLSVGARALGKVGIPAAWTALPQDPAAFLVARVERAECGYWWFGADKEMPYPEPQFGAVLEGVSAGVWRLRITARTLLRDLCVFVDRVHPEATVSDQGNTLLPGESITLEVRCPVGVTVEGLTRPPVLQTASRFGAQK